MLTPRMYVVFPMDQSWWNMPPHFMVADMQKKTAECGTSQEVMDYIDRWERDAGGTTCLLQ